jgi:hypothetical protein
MNSICQRLQFSEIVICDRKMIDLFEFIDQYKMSIFYYTESF